MIMIRIFFTLFVGFVLRVACDSSQRECSEVETKTICYFMPDVSAGSWNTAWNTCKQLDANLPFILSKEGQRVLGDYLRKHLLNRSVWLAGRYDGNESSWRWLNGQNFSGTGKPPCTSNAKGSCVQAVLTKQRTYSARNPMHPKNFICSFHGVSCQSDLQHSIAWNDGCLNWTNNSTLPLNQARNECLDRGGDLATFSEEEDYKRLTQFPDFLNDTIEEYWVGLRRKWWIWNTTDMHDIRYNLLDDRGDVGDGRCLYIDQNSTWIRDTCNSRKNIVCQSENTNVLTLSSVETPVATDKSTDDSTICTLNAAETIMTTSESTKTSPGLSMGYLVAIIIGSVSCLLVVIFVAVVSYRKLCRKNATDEANRPSDGNQTQTDEGKGVNDTTETCGVYAEVQRIVQDETTVNEPQTSILYATVEFANNNTGKEKSMRANHHQPSSVPSRPVASDTNGSTDTLGTSQAQDGNIYSEIMSQP